MGVEQKPPQTVVETNYVCDRCGRERFLMVEEGAETPMLPEGWSAIRHPTRTTETTVYTFDRRDCLSVWLKDNVIDDLYGRRPRKGEMEPPEADDAAAE